MIEAKFEIKVPLVDPYMFLSDLLCNKFYNKELKLKILHYLNNLLNCLI